MFDPSKFSLYNEQIYVVNMEEKEVEALPTMVSDGNYSMDEFFGDLCSFFP